MPTNAVKLVCARFMKGCVLLILWTILCSWADVDEESKERLLAIRLLPEDDLQAKTTQWQ